MLTVDCWWLFMFRGLEILRRTETFLNNRWAATVFIPRGLSKWLRAFRNKALWTSDVSAPRRFGCDLHVGDKKTQQVQVLLFICLSVDLRQAMHLWGLIKLWRLRQGTEGSLFFSLTTKLKVCRSGKRTAVRRGVEWNLVHARTHTQWQREIERHYLKHSTQSFFFLELRF